MMLPELAQSIRALADKVYAAAGEEHEAKTLYAQHRQRLLRSVAGELHRVGRMVERWIEGGGA